MRYLSVILLFSALVCADELDMFDVVDSEANATQELDVNSMNTSIKNSYLMRDDYSNDSVLFVNLSDHTTNYVYDVRLVGNDDDFNLYVKDLYYKTNIEEKYFFELGRMNVKEGVARGYNPTDYFKGSASLTLSLDPKEKKDNRLGALLFQATYIAPNYTLKVLYAPEVDTSSKSLWGDKKYIGLRLDESNAQERVSVYLGLTGLDDWSISALLHHNNDGLHLGTNISYIEERAIWYMEATLNERKSQIVKTLEALEASNDLVTMFDDAKSYRTELSLGLNYTFENNIVTTFEYIYNDAGFNNSDWNTYFDLIESSPRYAPIVGTSRGTIANKSQMLSKHTLFAMARKNDALPNLDWATMAWVNPVDKSVLVQVGVQYDYHDVLFSADIRSYMGNAKTEYGSMPNDFEALLSVEYFF